MQPDKNAPANSSDGSAADWNEEKPATPPTSEGQGTVISPDMSQSEPPTPAESTVGGPDMPSITEEIGTQVAATPTVKPDSAPGDVMPADSVPPAEAGAPLTSVQPTSVVVPPADTPPLQDDASVRQSTAPAPSEPSVHHPLSATILLAGLAVLIILVLAIFVLPMLF